MTNHAHLCDSHLGGQLNRERHASRMLPKRCLRPRLFFSIGFFCLVIVALPTTTIGGQDAPGSIVGWGIQVVGADGSGGFVNVVAGGGHTLGLKTDGSIVAW